MCSAVVDLIYYACSIYAIPFGSEDEVNWDSRPYVVGNFNGINVKCLIVPPFLVCQRRVTNQIRPWNLI